MQGNMTMQGKLSEKEILEDMLTQEKAMLSSYSTLIAEASCEKLRSVLTNNFNQTVSDQYQVFNQMKTRGYYTTKDAPDADVQTAKQSANTLKQGLA